MAKQVVSSCLSALLLFNSLRAETEGTDGRDRSLVYRVACPRMDQRMFIATPGLAFRTTINRFRLLEDFGQIIVIYLLAYYGVRSDEVVLEYFSQSPFFDKRSNNALLKMQSQFQNFGDVNEALRKMTGVEFVLVSHDDTRLFVIQKQQRDAIDSGMCLGVYQDLC